MGELYDEYLKKRKKNKKRIADEWNKENPNQKISVDDLAPVKTTSGKWHEDWFEKPKTFSDGLDLFDIHKTILGSGKDLEHDVAKGILKAGEGILDAGTFAAGKISEAFGNEKFAEKAYTFQRRDLVEETNLAERVLGKMYNSNRVMNIFDFGDEKNSVFAEKSDSLAQSAGQLGAAMGMQSVGVPWWATMGASSFGQSSGEAMKQGATSNEAAVYGAISAGAEVLSEKLFGGIKFGGKTLDEGAKKLLANAISNKTASALARFGFDAAGEGFEEVVTDVATRVGEKLTFGDDKTLDELLTSEEAMNSYIESFIGGAVMGGGFNVGRLGKSLKTGRDYDTGFSSNEQSIVDKEIKKRSGELQKEAAVKAEVERRISGMDKGANITDAEKRSIRKAVMEELDNGSIDFSQTKLSKKEAAEIEKQVVEDFKKGFFDIDTIEGTLMEAETAKISELKELKGKTTDEAKQDEIQKEIDKLTLEKNKKMKERVSNDYWLQESYRQQLLKGEEFAREAKDTDSEITKELAESAKAAGMNNTRKMHELFDYTNKIANDTDTKYGFTNSKQLKDMGYSKEDATINGMVRVQEDGNEKVLINVDSGKALNTIIGHETTRLLKGTQEHKDLVAVVKEYAEMKGEYDSRFKAVQELYQNVDANIENEVTADLVGDYIFTDEQFATELTKKPNVFQKVNDYIKHAYKMAATGSAEARQLEKAKRALEKAYKQSDMATTSKDAGAIVDYDGTTVPMDAESMRLLTKNMKEVLELNPMQRRVLKDIIQDYSTGKIATGDDLYNTIYEQFSVQHYEVINEELTAVKKALRETPIRVPDAVKDGIANYYKFRQQNFGKMKLGNSGLEIDDAYEALRETYPGHFPEDITNLEDQLYHMEEVANMESSTKEEYVLPEEKIAEATDFIRESVSDYKRVKKLDASLKWKNPDGTLTRAAVHAGYMQKIKDAFAEKGMDFGAVLENGKNLPAFASVDNTPQRFMEKTFGYKEGQILSDLTVNKAAENEAEAIRWLNAFTNKKNGILAKLSKKYNIKPGSKEDAAAHKYAEGMHVNRYGDYVEYGDRELETDIKDPQMRANIKSFVADPTIRKIYDETLDAINASRTRNGYAAIPRRDNYYLHFREMDDTFSKLGIPFNPNDIKAKDLPTDINGTTADNKPGQPWFGSSMQRKGVGTTYSLLGGLERYLVSAKPQIFHIDDIQMERALRNFVADTYGQAKGLERLDEMTDEEAEARIEKVHGAHLTNFAKFLNEHANFMAGKTALGDRWLESILGRRGLTFMNELNSAVAKSYVGFNVSSAMTNIIPSVQAVAKGNKYDALRAFTQTAYNRIKAINGKDDGFTERNDAIVRRRGEDKFRKKPYEKVVDTGFALMGAIDDVSTEFIVRTKYNELTRKGMDDEQAHKEAGKWAMRIMGDRSFAQQPMLYNQKGITGLFTKFQLEVRNQLDSMFYDTIQEANVSAEDIQNGLKKNGVKAAKIASTLGQLAVLQHAFGKAFESVTGNNPTFDIIENILILCGLDDEEGDDVFADNAKQAFDGLVDDLPYINMFTGGGRIPVSNAIPNLIGVATGGKDQYGNELTAESELKKLLYVLPGGSQIKKTYQGLKMFDDDFPIAGSYTDKGNLRFPVEDTPKNRIQAGLFGQWASENAREYFDGEHAPLKEKQIKEFKELDLPIADYWKIREDMAEFEKTEAQSITDQKLEYIDGLELPISKKNILANNLLEDRKEPVDMAKYNAFKTLDEFDLAVKNPGKYAAAKAIGGYDAYKGYMDKIGEIKGDKDKDGNTISGSAKEKIINYLADTDLEYGEQVMLLRCKNPEYKLDYDAHYALVEYLSGRSDIGHDDKVKILNDLGYTIDADGNVGW